MKHWLRVVLASGCVAGSLAAQETAVPADVAKMPYRNTALAMEKRVEDLLGRMTLEEKASQLVNQSRAIPRLGVPEYDQAPSLLGSGRRALSQ